MRNLVFSKYENISPYTYINKSRSFFSCKASLRSLNPFVSSDRRLKARENRLENTQPSRYPYALLNRETWSIMPIRRILLRTVSSIRGEKLYLSHNGFKIWYESTGGVFKLNEYSKKNFLVISIAWKQQLCKLIQSLHTANFATVKLDFCICHFHPGLLHQNMAFHAMFMNFVMLKFFW